MVPKEVSQDSGVGLFVCLHALLYTWTSVGYKRKQNLSQSEIWSAIFEISFFPKEAVNYTSVSSLSWSLFNSDVALAYVTLPCLRPNLSLPKYKPFTTGLRLASSREMYFSQCHRIRLGPKIAKVVTEIHLDRSKLSQQRGVMWIYHIPLQALFKILRPTKQPRIRNISRLVIEGFSASGKAASHSVIQSPWLKLVIPTLLKKLILILPLLRASRTKIAISLAFRAHHPIYFHK